MLTREEKIRLNMGKDGWSSYSPNEEIPSFRVTDGPVGVRMIGEDGKTIPSVAYPCFQSLAQTWNLTLAEKYADALADDCVDLGADILLGPGVNIKRTPLCGRNFEYFSEDPFVAGEFGRHYITALQKRGVGACLKHYCCNNQEEERYWISSEVDERTLREIYLKPFEIACKAKPWAVMTSYNRVNGVQVNESAKLHRVLREEFGFCGVVMSDWWAVHRPAEALNAGTNLIMPFDEKSLEKLIKSDSISEIALEENNRRVIDLAKKCAEARKTRCKKYSVEERREIARETAEEGIVLLKNNGVLPLSPESAGSLPVMGTAAERYYYGGGSSAVVPEIPYEKLHEALQKEGVAGAHFAWNEETGTFRNCAKEAETSYAVIVAVGDPAAVESEEKDRTSLRLSPEEELYIRELSKVNRNVIAVVYAGAPIDMSGWIGEVSAVVWAGYGGEKVNEAVARVLTGKVNPSGKTAETFPLSLAGVPAYRAKRTAESAYYEEGRAVGYRHFAKENASVLFPFGFGLSYSEFRYVDLTLKETAQTIEASFTVKNLSPRGGKETAQLYFSHKAAEEETQGDEFALKGFVKIFVAANSETRAKIEIKKADLSYYSVSSCEWKRYTGECQIFVGKNCNDLPLQAKIIL